jgi:hypothetical protein
MEIPKRLTPTAEVTRDLYLRSGNRCAYPGCNQPLMTADGVLVGQIAHIEAALTDGPRFRSIMSNEERRGFANLILLCPTHHAVIDRDSTTWTVQRLQALKADHEAIYTGAIDRLRSTVGDITEGTSWRSATNLGRLPLHGSQSLPDELAADFLAGNLEVLNGFARRLASLPVGARSVLALIVSRGDPTGFWGDGEVAIPVPVLEQIANCPKEELYDHMAVLEHAELATSDEEFTDVVPTIIARNSTPTFGWKIMADLKEMAAGDASIIRRVLVELDFTAFDT